MIFDIAAFIFTVLFSLIMMKKGGMKAMLSLGGIIISLMVASALYPVITDAVYATPLPENVEKIVSESILLPEDADIEVIDTLPGFIKGMAEDILSSSQEVMENSIAKAVTRAIINIVVFIVLLVATKLVISVATAALNLTMKLPVLKQLNSLVGLLCGIVISMVVVWAATVLLSVAATSNEQIAMWTEGSKIITYMSDVTIF